MHPSRTHPSSTAAAAPPHSSSSSATQSSLLKSGDAVKFEEIWPKIEPLVLRMFAAAANISAAPDGGQQQQDFSNSLTKAEWQDIFWNVHILCIWNMSSAFLLQQKLVDVFNAYITQEQEFIFQHAQNDLSLLKAYMAAWKRFMFYYHYVPLPFAPLERYFQKSVSTLDSTLSSSVSSHNSTLIQSPAGAAVISTQPPPPNTTSAQQQPAQQVPPPPTNRKRNEIESYIRLTMIELWVLKIFTEVNTRLTAGAMLLIDAERNNVLCDPYLIVGVKESCLYLCYYLQDKLFIYRNNYERVYIAATEQFYRAKGQQYYADHGILPYMRWVDGRIREEQDRAARYLEPHSLSKVLTAVVNTLVGPEYRDLLAEKFIPLIRARDVDRLHLMFTLLDRVEGGIEPLQRRLEQYLIQLGIDNLKMEALSIVQDSEKFIEHLLKLFGMATSLVTEAFGGDPRFLTARDMAFNVLINDKSVFLFAISQQQQQQQQSHQGSKLSSASPIPTPMMDSSEGNSTGENLGESFSGLGRAGLSGLTKSTSDVAGSVGENNGKASVVTTMGGNKFVESRCAELFANYCDMLLRKTALSRHLTSDQIECKLKNVILVLKYVQDKDMFMKFYKAHLTRRLILDASADNDKEEQMVNWLREVGMPADFVNKLSRMFQDLKVSEDFNRAFRETILAAAQPTSATDSTAGFGSDLVSVKILNSSAWSRAHEKVAVSLPHELEEVQHQIDDYYRATHSGRNLRWHHQFSSGLISYNSDVGCYDFEATAYQISVLWCWNDRPDDAISLESLSLSTQLPGVELRRTIWSLVNNPKLKSQVLLVDSPTVTGGGIKAAKDFRDCTAFRLNHRFALLTKTGNKPLKRGRVNLIGRLQLQSDKTREEEAESIVRLRTLRTQEAVVRILKARKSIGFAALHLELTNVLKQMFLPTKALIKEQLEWLIEQEYIRRDPVDANLFYYAT